jgi:nucleotide-binding universal stress UspA family protein
VSVSILIGEPAMSHLRTILHPTDFSECSRAAFKIACSLAREHGARLVVLHVTSVPDLAYRGYGVPGSFLAAEEYLEKVHGDLEGLRTSNPEVSFETRVEEGDPATEILHVAGETAAGLIVMGTHGQTCLTYLVMGSVADAVVRKASCPVLTLRAPAGRPVGVAS